MSMVNEQQAHKRYEYTHLEDANYAANTLKDSSSKTLMSQMMNSSNSSLAGSISQYDKKYQLK